MVKKNKVNDSRVLALEGVRGIAAIMVVMFHALISFFPAMSYGSYAGVVPHVRFDDNVFGSPAYIFINGIFAVGVFFVLSGFVLSISFFNAKNESDASRENRNQALKRYFRLMIPAGASVMIAWLILAIGLNYNHEAYQVTGSPRLSAFWSFEPNFFGALYQAFIGMFKGQDWYNQPLWTMRWEFLGSFLVFAILGIFGKTKARFVAYIVGAVIFAQSYLLGFLIGMVIADIYAHKKMIKIKTWQGVLLAGIGLCLAIVNTYNMQGVSGFLLRINSHPFVWYFIGATMIIIAVLATPKINEKLSTKPMVFFGKNTFSVYLLHDLVILTVMSFVFVKLVPILGYKGAVVAAFLAFFAVLIPAVLLFTKYVDSFAIRTSRAFANKFNK